MARLENKVALVTGAGRGIGEAIAQRFHEEGARVVVNDLDQARAERVANSVGGRAVVADVADSKAVAAMFETVRAQEGRLDILVNNAGIAPHETNPELADDLVALALAQFKERMKRGHARTHSDLTLKTSDEEWRRIIAVHLDGTFFCSREALRIMTAQHSGSIINLSSILATTGGFGMPAYSAAKAGILGLTRSLALELATLNIRVNAIAPGWIETSMTEPLAPLRPLLEGQTPLGRLGTPDDIAWAAVYLASDESAFVTGQVIAPNGGLYMSQ
jgi:3-oxoacyl-[acyl-carrier protein] reductase